MYAFQVLDVEIPSLEAVKAAQMASVGCEIAQAWKIAYLDKAKRRQLNLESRITLANAYKFTATDFLQVIAPALTRCSIMKHYVLGQASKLDVFAFDTSGA